MYWSRSTAGAGVSIASGALRAFFLACSLLLVGHVPAHAKVEIAFYSRDGSGRNFPHAFVTLRGTIDGTGETIDRALGFTSEKLSPAILLGPVAGKIIDEPPSVLAKAKRQFALTLTDRQYRAVDAVIRRWRTAPQPSYDFDRRNCLHFVGALAAASGLTVPMTRETAKRPRAFLLAIEEANWRSVRIE